MEKKKKLNNERRILYRLDWIHVLLQKINFVGTPLIWSYLKMIHKILFDQTKLISRDHTKTSFEDHCTHFFKSHIYNFDFFSNVLISRLFVSKFIISRYIIYFLLNKVIFKKTIH